MTHPNLELASLAEMRAGLSLADRFSLPFLKSRLAFPYSSEGRPHLALADPLDETAVSMFAVALGPEVVLRQAQRDDIETILQIRAAESAPPDASDPDLPDTAETDAQSLRDLAAGAPVVRALDDLIERAVAARATDIHVEPRGKRLTLRLRVDGLLRSVAAPRDIVARALVSRIKILAGLNITEHRLPQDGRFRTQAQGKPFDVRVATMPTSEGEAAVLRLLDRSSELVAFDALGLGPRDHAVLRQRLGQPNGMFIVTGPTGSGKTTTLASALATLNDGSRKMLTIEDPIEYQIPGINQSQARPAIGLTFAAALRAFLRQDPDVIMVGEVRDPETARISLQAALTGHLVLTTLHTNTAAGAITRLADIGIERYLIASTLAVVVAQRLVRSLCPHCREPYEADAAEQRRDPRLLALKIEPGARLFRARGCERCNGSGYRGRHAIFEVLDVTEGVRAAILAGGEEAALERAAAQDGMTTMLADGRARCLAGATSVEELFRVAALR